MCLIQDQTGMHKLSPPWEGPFVVSKNLNNGSYYLIDIREHNKSRTYEEETNKPWNIAHLWPQSYFFSMFCLHPAYPMFMLSVLCVCLSFHYDDYVVALLCLYLSTYSAASSSSLRNFLTLKFLSEEFIKIAYSPLL